MKVRELIAVLEQAPLDAYVIVNGQEYHLTGKWNLEQYADNGELPVVDLHVGLGMPDDFDDVWDRLYPRKDPQ